MQFVLALSLCLAFANYSVGRPLYNPFFPSYQSSYDNTSQYANQGSTSIYGPGYNYNSDYNNQGYDHNSGSTVIYGKEAAKPETSLSKRAFFPGFGGQSYSYGYDNTDSGSSSYYNQAVGPYGGTTQYDNSQYYNHASGSASGTIGY